MKLSRLAFVGVLAMSAMVAAEDKKPAPPKPGLLSVTKIDPAQGDPAGGTFVHVIGSGFLHDANGNSSPGSMKVWFGDREGTIVRFNSDTDVIVQAPGGKVGDKVDVLLVFDQRGEKKMVGAFTFVAPPKQK